MCSSDLERTSARRDASSLVADCAFLRAACTSASAASPMRPAAYVSYTHLDVYKRQLVSGILDLVGYVRLKGNLFTSPSPWMIAVSYTHLDGGFACGLRASSSGMRLQPLDVLLSLVSCTKMTISCEFSP